MTQPRYDYGGNGPVIHMALANGFPPQTYIPLSEPLTPQYRVISYPPRPLWDDPPAPSTAPTWQTMAQDILDGLAADNLTNVIGAGHSMGGVATMLAAIQQPGRFRAVILLDPTIFPPHYLWLLWGMNRIGLEGRFPLVKKALNRRAEFASQQAAFDYWRGKSLFTDWDDATLWHYVTGLTQPSADGGVRLAWDPHWEAHYYATIYTASWRQVPKLEGLLPVLLIRGTRSNTFFEGAAARFRRLVPSATYAEVTGGHLYPQAAPTQARAIITRWLATL